LIRYQTRLHSRAFVWFRPFLFLMILAALVASRPILLAQTIGIQPYGTYAVDFDQINLADLSVHIDIPLFEHKARGPNFGTAVHLIYDTPGAASGNGAFVTGGWHVTVATAPYGVVTAYQAGTPGQCTLSGIVAGTITVYFYAFTDATGYAHAFNGATSINSCTSVTTTLNTSAADGSGYLLSAQGKTATVTAPSGVIYGQTIVDTNGNESGSVLAENNSTLTDNSNISVTVTLGSDPSNPSGPRPAHTPTTVQYTDTSGNQRQVTVLYSVGTSSVSGLTGDQVVSVTFPDGTAYGFTYQPNTPGILASATLPTGGTITYQTPVLSGCSTELIRTTPDGATTYNRVVNSYPSGDNPCYATTSTTTVSKPDGTSEKLDFVDNLGSAPGGGPINLETAHWWYEASGNTIRSTMKCYDGASGDCTTTAVTLPLSQIATTTTLDSGQSSKSVRFINASGLPTEVDEYDIGASTPTRKTMTSYASLGNNIVDRPSSVMVVDGNGSTVSQMTYGYDEYTLTGLSLVQTSGLPGHSAITGARGNRTSQHTWLNTTGTTLDTHWQYDDAGQVRAMEDPRTNWTGYGYDTATDSCPISATPPTPSSGVSQSTSALCDPNTGLVSSTTDANGVKSSYSYDSMLRANGTTVTTSAGTIVAQVGTLYSLSSSPATITRTLTASPSSSQVSSITLDGLGRTSTVIAASGARTDTTYNSVGYVQSVSNPYFTSGESTYGITSFAYDALGRKTLQCQQDNGTGTGSCVAGASYLQWCYDGVATQQQQNCHSQRSSVTGTWVDAADELGRDWQQTSDGLGRLKEVVEPSNAATYYSYSALDNLTCAAQDGGSGGTFTSCSAAPASWRPRSFAYDSLSRLITAKNPETGTVCYGTLSNGTCSGGYDGNGNLVAKTDARGVVTSYTYDALNRLLGKTYTNAPATTLSSCYQYDTAPNGTGRLGSEWTQSGTCPSSPSTFTSLRVIGAYDGVGRVVSERQCAAGYCTSATVPPSPAVNCPSLSSAVGLQYCYDLAGDLLAYSNGVTTQAAGSAYPQHAILFSQTFDSAGHLITIGSSWNDSTHPPTLFSSATYAPTNSLSNWLLGSSLWTSRQYDKRLRVCNQQSALQQSTAPQCP
jgi:YD repeat-containing protein